MPEAHATEWQTTIDGPEIITTHAKRWEKVGGQHAKNAQKCWVKTCAEVLGRLKIYFRPVSLFLSPVQRLLRVKIILFTTMPEKQRNRKSARRMLDARRMLHVCVCIVHCCNMYYRITHRNYHHVQCSRCENQSAKTRMNERANDRMDGQTKITCSSCLCSLWPMHRP